MKKIIYILLILLLGTGCKKFVDVGLPENKLVTDKVFSSNETAISALTAVYPIMVSPSYLFPYRLSSIAGQCSDELTITTNNTSVVQPYLNALQPLNAPSNGVWTFCYKIIYQANDVYRGCSNSSSLNPAVKKQLMAEALFIRAYQYFYLVNLYGDVPLVTSTDYQLNSRMSRTPAAQVYQQIVDDLNYARNNLNAQYVDISSIAVSTERVRPNQSAATALLARVYLYQKLYSDSENAATIVINQKELYDTVPINQVFLANNKEAIWQIAMPNGQGIVTNEAENYIIITKPSTGVQRSNLISKSLLSIFEDNDLRKANWIGTATDPSTNPATQYLFPYKYKSTDDNTINEYSTVLRLAELYLIRAEARAQQSNLTGAVEDLNVIRKRAGLDPIRNTALSKQDVLDTIMLERRKELFCEYGHRWLDLKRSGKIDEVMAQVSIGKGAVWNSNKQLWPIPLTELQNNTNLTQNPSYN